MLHHQDIFNVIYPNVSYTLTLLGAVTAGFMALNTQHTATSHSTNVDLPILVFFIIKHY